MTFKTQYGDESLDGKALKNYLCSLINLFYKILPIWESGEKSIGVYMRSLQAELLGCQNLIEALHNDAQFVTLVSILQYLIDHPEVEHEVVKREVFRAISICEKLQRRYTEPESVGDDV